jgi:hypothetical protein
MNTKVPRIEDLPYSSSLPIEFVYRSTKSLSAGAYTWAEGASALTPDRAIMENNLYYFRSITLSADIEELDFTANISTIPKFQMYLKSNSGVALFREPIYMTKYLQNFDYRFVWGTQVASDTLLASFNGIISQGSSLIGKLTLSLTAIVSATEIIDNNFIAAVKAGYPNESSAIDIQKLYGV